jgi:hypothetical protein
MRVLEHFAPKTTGYVTVLPVLTLAIAVWIDHGKHLYQNRPGSGSS